MVIGKGGTGVEQLKDELEKLTEKQVSINVVEIKNPDIDAQLIAENIASQLERRISFRRATKQSISRAMKSGAKGIKTMVSGRLGGAEIARSEMYHEGTIPLQTIRADIDYGFAEAYTTYGRIGVKVWVYKGEILPVKNTHKAVEGGEKMLMPKRVKYRKQQRGAMKGKAHKGTQVTYGEYGTSSFGSCLDYKPADRSC